MEEHNIAYFRNLWKINMTDLENLCITWEKTCTNTRIPDEVNGEIRTTVGLARLLMNQKLKQFKGLIDDSEFNTGEKEVTCSDLQGFWDMVYFEVEKINKCFCRLDKCKNNKWKFVEENSGKVLKKKVPATKDTTGKKNDSSTSHALAAKQRLAEFKQKMLLQRKQQTEEKCVEIVPSNKQEFNTVKSDKALVESNKKSKNLNAREMEAIETNESTEGCLVEKNISKQKNAPQKSHPVSVQNKENFLPTDDTSNLKNISAVQTKSKVKTEAPTSEKVKRKSKEVIKLQCVTRSAKKAMLAQQNAIQKS